MLKNLVRVKIRSYLGLYPEKNVSKSCNLKVNQLVKQSFEPYIKRESQKGFLLESFLDTYFGDLL